MRWIVIALMLPATVSSTGAGTIGLNDFGSAAQVETFDFGDTEAGHNGILVSNGIAYNLNNAYRFRDTDCVSGICLGTYLDGSKFYITFDVPVDRVGGYLSGASDSLVLPFTIIRFFDTSNTLVGETLPVALTNTASSPSFFGFQTDGERIKWLEINPWAGLNIVTLDNFTSEIVAPVPLPPSIFQLLLGIGMFLLMRRRMKGAIT